MIEISDSVIVLRSGDNDQFPPENGAIDPNGYIKLCLIGSTDLNPNGDNWRDKFENSLAEIVKNVNIYRGKRFMILDCGSTFDGGNMALDNQNFLNKTQMDWNYLQSSDAVFCNFLKKSTAQYPVYLFSSQLTQQKMLVRCPEEHFAFPYIKMMSDLNNIPLLSSGLTTVTSVLGTMFSFIPKLQELQKYSI